MGDAIGHLLIRSRTDPEAFGELYDECSRTVFGFFLQRTGSPHTAVELAAETFAEALAGLHRFDPARGSGRGWLFGIAAHQLAQLVRRGSVARRHRRRLSIATPAIAPDDAEDLLESLEAWERGPDLRAAMAELTEGVRAAVELRVGHDLPYAEVAARLGVSEGSARMRVQRGLRQLTLALVAR